MCSSIYVVDATVQCILDMRLYQCYSEINRRNILMTYYKHKNGIQSNLSKTATLKKTKIVFQDQLSLNAGQKYCIMLQGEHSAILSIFIKLPSVIKIFVLSIFEGTHKTGFTLVGVLIDNRGSG